MSTLDALAVKLALAPFIIFLVIIAGFIYFKNRKS